jgi:phosphopantothenoylcysteine synthetase/decarboxylase
MRDNALSVIVCGSGSAIPAYLIWLRQEAEVPLRVLLTHSAERFVPPQLVAWYADEMFVSGDPALNPTEFARRSLGIVVLPCTANMIAAAALGLAATPAQTALLAGPQPVMFFPSMNEVMWTKRTTQRYVAALRDEGHIVVEPQWKPTFELWHRQNVIGPAMPTPEEATELIIDWLEKRLSDDGADRDEIARASAGAG